MPTYNNVYNFTAEVRQGFQATINILNDQHQLIDLSGFNVEMRLTNTTTNIVDFVWSTASGEITLSSNAILINIPKDGSLKPPDLITAPETYPHQIYNFSLLILDAQQQLYANYTGTFTIYITV